MATERDISLNDYLRARKIDPALATLVEHIAKSAIVMADHLKAAAFHDQIGNAGTRNVQDEEQKLLDVLADRVFRETCAEAASLAAYVSEEVDDVAWLKAPLAGDLILYVDPLDGSSNLEVNLSVGSIFAVSQVLADGSRNVLRRGREYLCAGYAIYGPSTLLVIWGRRRQFHARSRRLGVQTDQRADADSPGDDRVRNQCLALAFFGTNPSATISMNASPVRQARADKISTCGGLPRWSRMSIVF